MTGKVWVLGEWIEDTNSARMQFELSALAAKSNTERHHRIVLGPPRWIERRAGDDDDRVPPIPKHCQHFESKAVFLIMEADEIQTDD